MIRGLLVVLAMGFVGGRLGLAAGNWWIDHRMANAELEAIGPLLFGTVGGAVAGLAMGLAIAYALGKREQG